MTRSARLSGLGVDFFLIFAAILWMTAGAPFLTPSLKALFAQKPWIHRLMLVLISQLAVSLLILTDRKVQKSKQSSQSLIYNWLIHQPKYVTGWVWALFIGFGTVMTTSSWVRQEAFKNGFDMAIFVQAVWNTMNGDFLYSSVKGGICLLADHFSLWLAAMALPYRLWPDPKCLLLIQAFGVASAVFPLFLLAKFKTRSAGYSLLFVLAFLLYLPLRNAVRFEFHVELLAIPVYLWMFYLLMKGRKGWASFLLAILLLSKENSFLVTGIIGFYAFFFLPRSKVFGLFWMIFSPLYFYTVAYVLLPYVLGQEYFYLSGHYLAWLKDPLALTKHLLRFSTVAYLIKIFAPLGFLSFLDLPALTLTFPMLAQNLISRGEMPRSIYFQHSAYLIPCVMISAIYGLAKSQQPRKFAYVLIFFSFLMTGVSEYYVIGEQFREWTPELKEIKKLMKEIPAEASVRTHEVYASHLAHRKEIHIYENTNSKEGGSAKALAADYTVLQKSLLGAESEIKIQELLNRGYQLEKEAYGLLIFKRGQ